MVIGGSLERGIFVMMHACAHLGRGFECFPWLNQRERERLVRSKSRAKFASRAREQRMREIGRGPLCKGVLTTQGPFRRGKIKRGIRACERDETAERSEGPLVLRISSRYARYRSRSISVVYSRMKAPTRFQNQRDYAIRGSSPPAGPDL